jgi:hypothetical protein
LAHFKTHEFKKGEAARFSIESIPRTIGEFIKSDVMVGNESLLMLLDHEHLKGKTVLLDYMGPVLEQRLREAGVKEVITCTPRVLKEADFNFSIMEAIFQSLEPEMAPIDENKLLEWIDRLKLGPTIKKIVTTICFYSPPSCQSALYPSGGKNV